MATHCENCGTKLRGFFSLIDTIIWDEDENGIRHEFCSQDCAQLWSRKRNKARAKEKYGDFKPQLKEDLDQLYFKKKGEYMTFLQALAVTKLGDGSEDEKIELETLIEKTKNEIIELCALTGREPNL